MIFYLAIGDDNKTMIKGTQADAKAVNPQFEQIDIPVDKAGLMAWIQMMLDETLNAVEAEPEMITIATADMRADKDGDPSISHTIPAPKTAHNKFSTHPVVNEILTLAEIDECIDIFDERRLKQLEHSIAQRRDKLANVAAKVVHVEAD